MSGMSGMQGMGGMSGMQGSQPQHRMPFGDFSGRYEKGPGGDVYLYPNR
jgi:hypothetical protein